MARPQRRRGSWTGPWPSSSATASAASPGATCCTAFSLQADYRIEGDAVIVFRILHAARDHTRQLE
jgi:hypothetical protein